MKILVACEFSGIVREAFRKKGHDVWSFDLLPSEDNSPYHVQADVKGTLSHSISWDMLIAFPPCTHLASSGARWFKEKEREQKEALSFVNYLLSSPIEKICLENPIGIISTNIRKPDQIIQPWQFGHGETKATCLWLQGLPKLRPTNIVEGRVGKVHRMPPHPDRWRNRSRTYQGIADAMADQWSNI